MTTRGRGDSLTVRIFAGLAALALVAGLVLVFLPHGGSSTTSTSTAITTTPTTAASSTSGPTTTLADAAYQQIIESEQGIITSAGTDRCDLAIAFGQFATSLPPPANPAQTKLAVQATVALLTAAAAIAGGTGAEANDAATARALKDAASALTAEAEQKGYDPAMFNQPGAAALSTDAFTNAYKAYRQKDTELCAADGSSTTAGPGATAGPPAPVGPSTTAGPP